MSEKSFPAIHLVFWIWAERDAKWPMLRRINRSQHVVEADRQWPYVGNVLHLEVVLSLAIASVPAGDKIQLDRYDIENTEHLSARLRVDPDVSALLACARAGPPRIRVSGRRTRLYRLAKN